MKKNEVLDQLCRVNEAIAELEARMPAHSVKPPLMKELIELEDEREMLFALLAKLEIEEQR